MISVDIGETLTIRALTRDDLSAVVEIDAAIEGRARRPYVERRLAAALREPALHAQFAATTHNGLVGYILARVLEGEFGRDEAGLRFEMIGVEPGSRGRGVGVRLLDALTQWARRRAIRELRTSAGWRDAQMLRWLDTMGFELAPNLVLGREVGDAEKQQTTSANVSLPAGDGPGHEIDFGAPQSNDAERLGRHDADVRAMTPQDLHEIVRIDRSITGRDRGVYIAHRLDEAMQDSAVRVSLTARLDDAIVGYVMARADLGDFGRIAPVAVVDTIGVDAGYARRGVGRALLAQLVANLGALCIERIETVVAAVDLPLLGFFAAAGFTPSQRLAFVRRLDPPGQT